MRGWWLMTVLVLGLVACEGEPVAPTSVRLRLVDEQPVEGSYTGPGKLGAGFVQTPEVPGEWSDLDRTVPHTLVRESLIDSLPEEWWGTEGTIANHEAGRGLVVTSDRPPVVRQIPLGRCRDVDVTVFGSTLPDGAALEVMVGETERLAERPEDVEFRLLTRGSLQPLTRAESADGHVRFHRRFRAGRRSRALVVAVVPRTTESWTVRGLLARELTAPERIAEAHQAMGKVSTPVGAAPVAGRAQVGAGYNEVLFAPTDSRLTFRLPVSDQPATMSFGYGLLSDVIGRGDGEPVRFQIEVSSGDQSRTVFEDVLAPSRNSEDFGPRYRRIELGALPGPTSELTLSTTSEAPEPRMAAAAWCHPVVEIGAPEQQPGLVVISLDTLRADRLGCLGNEDSLTPTLDALAEESVLFTRARSPASFTLPSHASMFSGQYPSVHGMTRQGLQRDRSVTRWLAESARELGLRTASFNGGLQLSPAMGIEGGFETYHVSDPLKRDELHQIEDYLDSVDGEPLFLFLHTYIAHDYTPPQDCIDAIHGDCDSRFHGQPSVHGYLRYLDELTDDDRVHIQAMYDATVLWADRQVGRVLESLERRGILDRSALIVIADHGEELFDHGGASHGHTLYHEQLSVPLMVRPAGGTRGRRVDSLVEVLDLSPTGHELLGVTAEGVMQGRSLMPLIRGEAPTDSRAAYAEIDNLHHLISLSTEQWKGIARLDPDTREIVSFDVYDLTGDPTEQRPLPSDHALVPVVRQALEERRASLQRLRDALGGQITSHDLDPDTIAELEAAGYMVR